MISMFLSTQVYDPISAVIRYVTMADWSHAGFFDHERNMTFSAMLRGGVAWRKPGNARYLFLMAPYTDMAFKWFLTQEGKPYDYTAIAGMAMHRNWRCDDSWFCSEGVAAAYDHTPAPFFNKSFQTIRIVPVHLLLPPVVTEFGRMHVVANKMTKYM